jgi:hypothetical protein
MGTTHCATVLVVVGSLDSITDSAADLERGLYYRSHGNIIIYCRIQGFQCCNEASRRGVVCYDAV